MHNWILDKLHTFDTGFLDPAREGGFVDAALEVGLTDAFEAGLTGAAEGGLERVSLTFDAGLAYTNCHESLIICGYGLRRIYLLRNRLLAFSPFGPLSLSLSLSTVGFLDYLALPAAGRLDLIYFLFLFRLFAPLFLLVSFLSPGFGGFPRRWLCPRLLLYPG